MKTDIVASPIKRALLMSAGSFFVALGVVGIFIPLLPTTPFLLLAAYCYLRSSERLHTRLLTNRWFGKYIKDYQEGNGIPLMTKTGTLALLWVTITISAVFFVDVLLVRGILLVIAIAISVHVLMLKTLK
jgi:uncharacterized membrane protein YbaN (DUF454 family)